MGEALLSPHQRFIVRLGEVGPSSSQARRERHNREDTGRCCAAGFLKFYFIYLAALGLGCSTWDLQSSMRHVRSLVVAFRI